MDHAAGTTEQTPVMSTANETTGESQKLQKIPTLRPRKSAKKSTSQDWTHVTEHEINMMQLPAAACRTINFKLRQTYAEKEKEKSKQKRNRLNNPANDGFLVKTANITLYEGELNFKHLTKRPTSLCPNPEDHVFRVCSLKHDLPLACPTCWSAQRN